MYDHNSRRYVAANNGDTLADYYWEDEPFDDGTSSIAPIARQHICMLSGET